MKSTKMLGIVAAAAIVSGSAFAIEDLSDTWNGGVMDSDENCVKTTGGIAACGSTPAPAKRASTKRAPVIKRASVKRAIVVRRCVVFRGDDMEDHNHSCLASGTVKVSNYRGAKAKQIAALLKRHEYLLK